MTKVKMSMIVGAMEEVFVGVMVLPWGVESWPLLVQDREFEAEEEQLLWAELEFSADVNWPLLDVVEFGGEV
jgi:hypothetical protein